MLTERLIFQARSGQHLRLVLSGKLDARLLAALDSYIARQRIHLRDMTDALETEAFEWAIEGVHPATQTRLRKALGL